MLQIGKGAWHLSAAHIPEMNLQKKKKKVLYITHPNVGQSV